MAAEREKRKLDRSMRETIMTLEDDGAGGPAAAKDSEMSGDDDGSMPLDDKESDILDENDIMINYSDMDQSMKGDDINYIGHVQSLDKRRKDELRAMNYEFEKDKGA